MTLSAPPSGTTSNYGSTQSHKYPEKIIEKNGTNGLKNFMRLNAPEPVSGILEMKPVQFDGSKRCLVVSSLQENIFIFENFFTMKKIN